MVSSTWEAIHGCIAFFSTHYPPRVTFQTLLTGEGIKGALTCLLSSFLLAWRSYFQDSHDNTSSLKDTASFRALFPNCWCLSSEEASPLPSCLLFTSHSCLQEGWEGPLIGNGACLSLASMRLMPQLACLISPEKPGG